MVGKIQRIQRSPSVCWVGSDINCQAFLYFINLFSNNIKQLNMKNTVIIAHAGGQYPVSNCTFYADCIEAYCEHSGTSIIPNGQWDYSENEVTVDTMTYDQRMQQNQIDRDNKKIAREERLCRFIAIYGPRPNNPIPDDKNSLFLRNTEEDENICDVIDIINLYKTPNQSLINSLPSWFSWEEYRDWRKANDEWQLAWNNFV